MTVIETAGGRKAMGDVTDLVQRARDGDASAMDRLVELIYPDLHRLARSRLAHNDTITLLDATSMVHEA